MIHTQSNALVTSKIRARKTPKLIRSRVASNAIAGKPVPPEVRKKIFAFHRLFTLIYPPTAAKEERKILSHLVVLFFHHRRVLSKRDEHDVALRA